MDLFRIGFIRFGVIDIIDVAVVAFIFYKLLSLMKGTRSAQIGARIITGHLEGTHGGLDRASSLGFYLTNDPDRAPAGDALRVTDVLLDLHPHVPLRVIPWDD